MKFFSNQTSKTSTKGFFMKVKSSKGFTLIELMVAVSIFSIVMLIAVGALLSLLAANERAQNLKIVMNNLNLAVENMAREIRVGSHYHCIQGGVGSINIPQSCPNGSVQFAFERSGGDTTTTGDQMIFRLNNGQLERSENGGALYMPITSPDLLIEELRFRVYGAESGDSLQPRVKIFMAGKAGIRENIQTDFSIQTTVTQRLLDS